MGISKFKEPQTAHITNLESEVASFASSIGLSSSLPTSGFNDTDFRKTGPLRPHKPSQSNSISYKKPEKRDNGNKHTIKHQNRSKSRVFPPLVEDMKGFNKFENLPKLPLMKASSLEVWYTDAAALEAKVIGGGKNKKLKVENVEQCKDMVEKKRKLGERLLAQYSQDYESSQGQQGNMKLRNATLKAGTTTDKLSVYLLLVGENPIANLKWLDKLLAMVTSKCGKRHAFRGFQDLKELFISSLLPDRELKDLLQQPLNNLPESKDGYSLLLFWYWEECLKQRYKRFILELEEASRDLLPNLKDKALKTMYALLANKSEQGCNLLSALVNKLGDPANKSASSVVYLLLKLLSEHPLMKAMVIDEVDSFLFRPHLGFQAKYHAVNFLSQIHLSHKGDGPKVAKRLIDIYFALFKVLISETGSGRKMDKNSKAGDGKDSTSFKDNKVKCPSESHVELDSRLLSALLRGVNGAFPYVSADEADDIIEVQTPMLFRLVHSKNFNVGVQALMLLDKISSKNQIVSDRFYRALYSKLLLPAALITSKAELFLRLVQRAMINDISLKRVAAFSKRILQVALHQPAEYACECLLLLSNVLKARPPLWNIILQNECVDEELEHFKDVEEETDNEASTSSQNSKGDDDGTFGNSDNFFESESKTKLLLPAGYNPQCRDPSYCNGDRVSWWELVELALHVHPSVATMAKTLLCGVNIVYNGNPLKDLSFTAFLDKFLEKKPKPIKWHGGSQIEPAKKVDVKNHLIGEEIVSLAEEDVPPEDLVFHKFYMNKMNSLKKPKKKKKKGLPQEDEEASEEFSLGDDESDNEKLVDGDKSDEDIESMLDSAADPLLDQENGDYNYDDLDKVANDDDDLVGNVSDAEMDDPSFDDIDHEEDLDYEHGPDQQRKRKREFGRKSPFASLGDYKHLLDDDDDTSNRAKKSTKSSRKSREEDVIGIMLLLVDIRVSIAWPLVSYLSDGHVGDQCRSNVSLTTMLSGQGVHLWS